MWIGCFVDKKTGFNHKKTDGLIPMNAQKRAAKLIAWETIRWKRFHWLSTTLPCTVNVFHRNAFSLLVHTI